MPAFQQVTQRSFKHLQGRGPNYGKTIQKEHLFLGYTTRCTEQRCK
jgi:hypothetical protein